MTTNNTEIENALEVLSNHIVALNNHDAEALATTLHFPHYRLSNGTMKVWETPEHYFSDFKSRAGSDWSYSKFENITVVGSSEDKVHVNLDVIRYRADNSEIVRFSTLWVLTMNNSRWAAQLRSSFSP